MDESREKRLKIKTGVDEDSSMISVHIEDTGCGIPEESLNKIFIPYYTSKQCGIGLGLPVVGNIVKKLMGRYTLKVRSGKGLPLRQASQLKTVD